MSNTVENQELLQDFLAEASEMLDDVDIKLVELEKRPNDSNLLNAVFRGFHTIKGGAGFLEATPLVELCHRGENLLDALRNHKMVLTAELMDVILAATGDVRRMFSAMTNGFMPEPAHPELIETLERALRGELVTAPQFSVQTTVATTPAAAGDQSTSNAGGPDWNTLYSAVTGKVIPVETGVQTQVQQQTPHKPANAPPQGGGGPPGNKEAALRVDVSRFDQILNLTGEVGLTKNRLLCVKKLLVDRQHLIHTKRLIK
jgi:two-component system chemotaxis sensor kinase CheA